MSEVNKSGTIVTTVDRLKKLCVAGENLLLRHLLFILDNKADNIILLSDEESEETRKREERDETRKRMMFIRAQLARRWPFCCSEEALELQIHDKDLIAAEDCVSQFVENVKRGTLIWLSTHIQKELTAGRQNAEALLAVIKYNIKATKMSNPGNCTIFRHAKSYVENHVKYPPILKPLSSVPAPAPELKNASTSTSSVTVTASASASKGRGKKESTKTEPKHAALSTAPSIAATIYGTVVAPFIGSIFSSTSSSDSSLPSIPPKFAIVATEWQRPETSENFIIRDLRCDFLPGKNFWAVARTSGQPKAVTADDKFKSPHEGGKKTKKQSNTLKDLPLKPQTIRAAGVLGSKGLIVQHLGKVRQIDIAPNECNLEVRVSVWMLKWTNPADRAVTGSAVMSPTWPPIPVEIISTSSTMKSSSSSSTHEDENGKGGSSGKSKQRSPRVTIRDLYDAVKRHDHTVSADVTCVIFYKFKLETCQWVKVDVVRRKLKDPAKIKDSKSKKDKNEMKSKENRSVEVREGDLLCY